MRKSIYFDNAATSFPKPDCVHRDVLEYAKNKAGNPGRGSHELAMSSSDAVFYVREKAAKTFSTEPENVCFTANVTSALNIAIKGLVRYGDHLLISNMEHNAVLRPVSAVCRERAASFSIFSIIGGTDNVIASIKSKLTRKTRILITTHVSNLCGITAPIKEIGAFCRENGIVFIVDAAQSAGVIPVSMREYGIDILCVTGHKSLYGYMGVGAIIFGDNISPSEMKTIIEGGSGIDSIPFTMPSVTPERFEAGTLPSHAIVSMGSGIDWVESVGKDKIYAHEMSIAEYIITSFKERDGVILCSDAPGAAVLFNIDGMSPADVSRELNKRGIYVRSGLHCAPLAHKTLSTFPSGAVRVGIGAFNNLSEAKILCDAVHDISSRRLN